MEKQQRPEPPPPCRVHWCICNADVPSAWCKVHRDHHSLHPYDPPGVYVHRGAWDDDEDY